MQSFPNIKDGRKTVASAGTRERLVSSNTPCKVVTITALIANTNEVVIGGSTVVASAGTRSGVPLFAGQSVTLYIEDLYALYIDSVTNGEGVSFIYQF